MSHFLHECPFHFKNKVVHTSSAGKVLLVLEIKLNHRSNIPK